jgi:hypothetical protein
MRLKAIYKIRFVNYPNWRNLLCTARVVHGQTVKYGKNLYNHHYHYWDLFNFVFVSFVLIAWSMTLIQQWPRFLHHSIWLKSVGLFDALIPINTATSGIFYSLPFAFPELPINVSSFDTSISTLIASDMTKTKYESFEKVKTLLFIEKCEILYQDLRTSNIVRLVLKVNLPSKWHFLLVNLRHLECQRGMEMSSTDFTHFLEYIPALQSLTLPISILSKLTDRFTNSMCRYRYNYRLTFH